MGRIDTSGRIADRTITHALGWHPGDRLTLAAIPVHDRLTVYPLAVLHRAIHAHEHHATHEGSGRP